MFFTSRWAECWQRRDKVKEREAVSEERESGPNFQGARIGKVVIGDDRSISDVEAKQFQVAGDGSRLEMSVQLPEPSETDMDVNLDAIREIVKALQLEAEDAEYVERQLDNAKDEVDEAEPDKGAVGKALERTTKRLKEVGKLAGAISKLTPYAMALGQWLGKAYSWWDRIGD